MGRNRVHSEIPTYDDFIKPVLQVLINLGGSGTIEEINGKVFELLNLGDKLLQIPHGEDDSRTEVEYRLAWTRTYLKKYGLLINSERGIWTLTEPNINPSAIDTSEIVRIVKEKHRQAYLQKNKTKSATKK